MTGFGREQVAFLVKHPAYQRDPAGCLARLLIWRALTLGSRSATVAFPTYGVRFFCPSEWRGMAKLAFVFREFCELELPHISSLVPKAGIAIDVGAHYGDYTLALATAVGPAGRVLAVEPQQHACAILQRNVALNRFQHVSVLPIALGDSNTSARLGLHADPSRSSLGLDTDAAETVTVERLDDRLAREAVSRVDFMKLDIEGAELFALRGAEQTLRTYRPTLLIEIQPVAAERLGVPGDGSWRFLEGLDYRFWRMTTTGTLTPVAEPPATGADNFVAIPIERGV